MKLPNSFYSHEDVVLIAEQLLGKFLFTKIDGNLTGGMIMETEAYKGVDDKASHAYKGKVTSRTAPLYENGGVSYVYLCYGMHHLLNVVTNKKDIPHAVLIRALYPTEGLDIMLTRKKTKSKPASGPGSLCKSLGITKDHNNIDLTGNTLWIEDRNVFIKKEDIIKSPRVGIDYAQEHAKLPWRFRINSKTAFFIVKK